MIYLFKVNEVFWNDKPKINDYFTFDTNDIEFDVTKYDISLYFPTADYYLHYLNDAEYFLTTEEIYQLKYVGNKNPMRILVPKDNEIYNIIREFHIKKSIFFI
jgi:hypothetical protein